MTEHNKQQKTNTLLIAAIAVVTVLILFNQYQITQLSTMLSGGKSSGVFSSVINKASFAGKSDLGDVDLSSIQSTPQAMAAVMDLEGVTDAQTAINKLIPTGTPEYGAALGVSYDQPVPALQMLQRLYYALNDEIKNNHLEVWQRYLNLATKPVGISCEYCCGVGPIGITPDGKSRCGCSHNPAILALTMWLMQNTEMSDAEILQEALKWKTLWFPKDMVGMAMQIAGGDTSVLENVPGMVGGC
jgi:hypothetical protein